MMAYKEKLVCVVKCGGRILREHDGMVTIPFGSEYSLLFKNLESRHSVVNVDIDGSEVVKGLVIKANSEVELERFVKDLDEGNRFRFIQKTKQISEYRGDKIDDGIIRISFQFVQWPEKDIWLTTCNTIYNPNLKSSCHAFNPQISCSCPRLPRPNLYCIDVLSYNSQSLSMNASINENSVPKVEEGITVPGSISNQKFLQTNVGKLEEQIYTIILRLKGTTSKGKKVKKPITTNQKITCPICGHKSRSNFKFCGNCSTALI